MEGGSDEEQPDVLSALPPAIVACIALQLLDEPAVLLRLAVCSHYFHETLTSCEPVWKILSKNRGWQRSAFDASWFDVFTRLRARLCSDCGTPTQYVFTLLQRRRLCERCEAGNPRYRLCTQAEAAEEHGLSADQLATLPFRDVARGVVAPQLEKQLRGSGQARFYLLSAVVELAQQRNEVSAPRLRRRQPSGEEPLQFEEEPDAGPADVGDASASSEEEGGETPWREKTTAEERKLARRAKKDATKQANRARRAAKSAASGGGSASAAAAIPAAASPAERYARTAPFSRSAAAYTPPSERRERCGRGRSWAGSPGGSSAPLSRALIDEALGAFAISGLELAV